MKQQQFKKTVLALLLTITSGVALSAPYDIVDLGGLEGNYSVAYKINEQGVVVGTANGPLLESGQREFFSHAVKYNSNGNEDLGVLTDGKSSEALSINSSGIAVGYANKFTEVTQEDGTTYSKESLHAVIFDNGVEALPEKENLSLSRAIAINDNNMILGYGRYDVDTEDETPAVDRGFIYNPVDESYFMVTPLADEASRLAYVTDLNNTGKVLGFSDANVPNSSEYTVQSFIIDTTNSNEIITIPTVDKRATFAQSININDEVVGSVYIRGTRNNQEAFYYDAQSGSDTLTFLGFLRSDYTDSRARDINDNGQIVGRALVSVPTLNEYAAFIYENDEMKNLNTMISCDTGWKLVEATSINNSGQIVGFGVKDGEIRAFRLDPTGGTVDTCETEEEPKSGGGSTPFLMLVLLGLFAARKRK